MVRARWSIARQEDDRSQEGAYLEVQLSGGEDDVFSGLLDQRLYARVGLVEESKTLDELGKLRRYGRLKGDSNNRRSL